MKKDLHSQNSPNAELLEVLNTWCFRHGISISTLLERSGLSRASGTWWKKGVNPSRIALKAIEHTMKEIETERCR